VTREQQFDLPAARLLPLLLLLLILAGCGGGNGAANPVAGKTRGEVIRYRQVAAYNKGQINAALTFAGQRDLTPVPYAVTVYEVVYATPNVRGEMSQASGMVAVPEAAAGAARPLVAYFHGTQTLRTDVPSNPKNAEGQGTAFLFAAGVTLSRAQITWAWGSRRGSKPLSKRLRSPRVMWTCCVPHAAWPKRFQSG
jgi:hypothetical protein